MSLPRRGRAGGFSPAAAAFASARRSCVPGWLPSPPGLLTAVSAAAAIMASFLALRVTSVVPVGLGLSEESPPPATPLTLPPPPPRGFDGVFGGAPKSLPLLLLVT